MTVLSSCLKKVIDPLFPPQATTASQGPTQTLVRGTEAVNTFKTVPVLASEILQVLSPETETSLFAYFMNVQAVTTRE